MSIINPIMWTKCKSSVPAGQPCEEYTHSWWTCLNQQCTYEHHNLAKVIEFTAESANHFGQQRKASVP